jgi:hypothetical protein
LALYEAERRQRRRSSSRFFSFGQRKQTNEHETACLTVEQATSLE